MNRLIQKWKHCSKTTKFSIIAFIITATLGLLSMGMLGALLYYPVCFLIKRFPDFNSWHGDWVWPALISVGMFWSLGFILAGLFHHFLKNKLNVIISFIVYISILWIWALILWYVVLASQNWSQV